MRTWTHVDKSAWGPGPWDGECDKAQWIDEATDLDCMVRRGPMGNWCGYVGVPPGHPAHGRDYDDIGEYIEVHGGPSYSDYCEEDVPEAEGICHVPDPGRPADVWWIGFDCGHGCDVSPAMEACERLAGMPPLRFGNATYKTIAYVRQEVTNLAAQLAR